MSEKFCLRWNDFETNISSGFRDIRKEKEFFDVTLIGCDNDQIQAHKVILSACSPFFRMILKRNRHEHPLLYMKGISLTNLTCVLDFMYHGEVNVAQDDLNSFLAVAEELKVKGLTQKKDPESKSRQHTVAEKTRQHSQPKYSSAKPPPYNEDDDIEEVLPIKTEPAPSSAAETGVVASSQMYGEEEEYAHYYEETELGYSEEIGQDGSKGE